MSPEQASGHQQLTVRSDTYALGCMLYEMLAGEPPFTGPTAQAILARVLTEEPRALNLSRRTVPAHVEAAVLQALEKLPADRFATVAEFAAALEGKTPVTLRDHRSTATVPQSKPRRLTRTVGLTGLAAVLAVIGYLAVSNRESARGGPMQWAFALPDSIPLAFIGRATLGVGLRALDLSPDGKTVVFVGEHNSTTALFIHDVGTFQLRLLPGTEGAFFPFFKPDGQWIGFFAGRQLKKIAIDGGKPTVLADVIEPFGGDWGDDDRIAVVNQQGNEIALFRSSGGQAEWRFPTSGQAQSVQFLPGNRTLLVQLDRQPGVATVLSLDDSTFRYLNSRGGPPDTIRTDAALFGRPQFVKSGHLLYVSPNENTLLAIEFDPRSLRVRGQPVPVLTGVRTETSGTQFSVSNDGTIAFAPGANAAAGRFVWADAKGKLDTLPLPESVFGQPDISPNGELLVVPVMTAEGTSELRVYDLADLGRGAREQSPSPVARAYPRWTPDSKSILMADTLLYRVHTPLGSRVDTLGPGFGFEDFSPDSQFVATTITDLRGDIVIRRVSNFDSIAFRLNRPGIQGFQTFSPDGRWLVYASQEAGRWEIYLTSFPGFAVSRKVSVAGGEEPVWSPNSDRIFYRYNETFYVTTLDRQTGKLSAPTPFITGPFVNVPGWSFDVSGDGQRLLLVKGPVETSGKQIRFIRGFDRTIRAALRGGR
jgi:eukaryotic-like serine/threonine-protein kinase